MFKLGHMPSTDHPFKVQAWDLAGDRIEEELAASRTSTRRCRPNCWAVRQARSSVSSATALPRRLILPVRPGVGADPVEHLTTPMANAARKNPSIVPFWKLYAVR
jgi:hypothetical protein